MQDENHGYDVKILDVSDYSNINVLSTFSSDVDPNSMAHNGIIKGNLLYVAYYHDGLRVFDISNPSNPTQVNYYDTYLPNDHISYRGAWGVYPYLESGNICLIEWGDRIKSLLPENIIIIESTLKKTKLKWSKKYKKSINYFNKKSMTYIVLSSLNQS